MKLYRKKKLQPMRPYVKGEFLSDGVSISEADIRNGSPKTGDMIAHNPTNLKDRWLIAENFFKENYIEVRDEF